MATDVRAELIRVVTARVLDLRAELEAQLRAVVRLEDDLRKAANRKGEDDHRFEDAVRRASAEMLTNNQNIRDVLTELAKEAQPRASV
jgi:arginine deiminase